MTIASVHCLVWDPLRCGAKPGLRQALWGAHLQDWGRYLHCCMPHTSLCGDAPDGDWGRGRVKAAGVCLSSEMWSSSKSSSLCVSLPALLLPLPSLLSPSPLSFHLMWRRAVCHSRVCTEKGSEVAASARRLSFDPCPEACLTAKKSMETKRLSQSDS